MASSSDPSSASKPSYLDPSPLGTKEYWDTLYTTDLSTHATQPTHIGQTWFDDSAAEAKTLAFLAQRGVELGLSPQHTSFLDLGTGNASMLLALRDSGGWTGGEVGLWGCDYSWESVRLARRVVEAVDRGVVGRRGGEEEDSEEEDDEDEEGEGGEDGDAGGDEKHAATFVPEAAPTAPAAAPVPIHLVQHDILSSTVPPSYPAAGFDVVLDKGTLDAISLSDEVLASGKRGCEAYVDAVRPLVRRNGGLLLITSCNWTETELRGWIEGKEEDGAGQPEGALKLVGKIKYPAFKFGGKEGSTLVGLCWQRD